MFRITRSFSLWVSVAVCVLAAKAFFAGDERLLSKDVLLSLVGAGCNEECREGECPGCPGPASCYGLSEEKCIRRSDKNTEFEFCQPETGLTCTEGGGAEEVCASFYLCEWLDLNQYCRPLTTWSHDCIARECS